MLPIPLNNKYTRWYNKLISSRQNMNRIYTTNCGLERHHIIPKSLGGTNKKSNIVVFTPREHCIAHILLSKMFLGEAKGKMCYSLIALSSLRNKNRSKINSKQYQNLRNAHYKVLSDPDYIKLKSENTKKQWTPERKLSVSQKTKQQWIDGNKLYYKSDEWKERQKINTTKRWQDPVYRKARSDQAKKQWSNGGSLRIKRPKI